jgi:hypothetical protein
MFNSKPSNVTECYIPDGSRFFVRNGVEMSDTKKFLSKKLGVDFEEKLNELNAAKVRRNNSNSFYQFYFAFLWVCKKNIDRCIRRYISGALLHNMPIKGSFVNGKKNLI